MERETVTLLAPPPVVAEHFGAAADGLLSYAAMLAGDGVTHGLLGPREVPRLWDRHILNCAVVAPAFPPGAQVLDLGSGAGLPGLVLALVRPDLDVTLLEPSLRRIRFLERAVAGLTLSNVRVLRGRAEEVTPVGADVVTARAVAPLAVLTRWSVRHVRPGGEVLAFKGARVASEVAAAADTLVSLHATAEVLEFGQGLTEEPTTVVRIRFAASPARRSRIGAREGRSW